MSLSADLESASDVIENIRIAVRCRPFIRQELQNNKIEILEFDQLRKTVSVRHPHGSDADVKLFKYDEVFGPNSSQADVYNVIARPCVDSVLNGYNGTIIAYGQTGSGKTYTMEGLRDEPKQRGIIPNCFAHIFDHIAKSQQNVRFVVHVSYLEIYNEVIRDLLSKQPYNKLQLKERNDVGVYVKNLSTFACHGPEDMDKLMRHGSRLRHTGETLMNQQSSRSHAVFCIRIEQRDSDDNIKVGTLNLVDLAGSERVNKSGTEGEALKETVNINLSLSNLGNVISALVEGRTHIPYRNSKLTRLLQDALGGNSKTVMIANIGPSFTNYDETMITLRYVSRVKSIRNKVFTVSNPKDTLLRRYENEIKELRDKLRLYGIAHDDGANKEGLMTDSEKLNKKTTANDSVLDLVDDGSDENKMDMEELRKKVKALEKKIITGGENLLDKAKEQLKLLEQSESELEKSRQSTQKLQEQLKSVQAESSNIAEKYNSLQEESIAKSKKMKEIWYSILDIQSEMVDVKEEHNREMEVIEQAIIENKRELSFFKTIVDTFVTAHHQSLIRQNSTWNETIGEWQIKGIAYAGNNMIPPSTAADEENTFETVESSDDESVYVSLPVRN